MEFLDVLDRTVNGESVYPDKSPSVQIGEASSEELTDREFDIIRELVMGKSYQEIAHDMNISVNTVKGHLKSIYAKTGYKKSLQVVMDAVGQRLVLPDF